MTRMTAPVGAASLSEGIETQLKERGWRFAE